MGIIATILVALLILFLVGIVPAGRKSPSSGLGVGGVAALIAALLLGLWLA